jgi:hypothetical protein
MVRHAVIASALVIASASVRAESPATGCCGPCEMKTCVDLHPEEPGTARLEQSSELFFGSVVAAEVLTCCENDPRADVTFKVTRRWKGADTPRVTVRTRACTGIYPFALGRDYLVSAEGTPPVLSGCYPPLEGTAADNGLDDRTAPHSFDVRQAVGQVRASPYVLPGKQPGTRHDGRGMANDRRVPFPNRLFRRFRRLDSRGRTHRGWSERRCNPARGRGSRSSSICARNARQGFVPVGTWPQGGKGGPGSLAGRSQS